MRRAVRRRSPGSTQSLGTARQERQTLGFLLPFYFQVKKGDFVQHLKKTNLAKQFQADVT